MSKNLFVPLSHVRDVAIITGVVCLALGTLAGFGLAHQRAEAKVAAGCAGQMPAYTAELERSVEFWRNLALGMRTEGVDSLRPVKEGKP